MPMGKIWFVCFLDFFLFPGIAKKVCLDADGVN